MENYNLDSDLDMDIKFDFQHDFTATENRVMDELLTDQTEADDIFNGMRENPSSYFEYFRQDSNVGIDLDIAEQFQQQPMVSIENGVSQAGFNHAYFSTAPCDNDASMDVQNDDGIDFDWTTFLADKSPGFLSPTAVAQSSDTNGQQNPALEDSTGSAGSTNVINDNGFIYQELKTLDITRLYGNLCKTFGLDDLKKLDKCFDYSALSTADKRGDHDGDGGGGGGDAEEPLIDHPIAKKKVFLMPLQMDPQSNAFLQNIATKLTNQPMVLNSIINKCDKSKDAKKLETASEPKKSVQQSEQYLSMRERLARVATKPIALPMINKKTTSTERRPRKQTFKIENEKMPIQYSVQIILHDIRKTAIFNSSSNSKETATEKPAKVKKMSKSKPTMKKCTETAKAEPKKSRRSIKKN